ncbi:MAG: hypothetical protein ACRCU3_02795, partial [Eubacteriaceae bacterium]
DNGHVTNYSISFGNQMKEYYQNKGMDVSELRIRFKRLFGFTWWRYNNYSITNTDYSNREISLEQIKLFNAESLMLEIDAPSIIHEFEIYHTADPSRIFTNYLQMEFN